MDAEPRRGTAASAATAIHSTTTTMGKASLNELIDGLNVDLAHEYAAVIQYRTYASAVSGPHR